jgi:hypothetical protein
MNKDNSVDKDKRDVPYVIHEEVLEEVDGGARAPRDSNLTSLALGEENQSSWL